jgi:Zn-dependent membrane protease YugP
MTLITKRRLDKMFFDPLYMIIALFGMALVFLPQVLVKNTFSSFSKIRASKPMTGAQVALGILNDAGIYDVSIEAIPGTLSDNYDPTKKVLNLSEEIYSGNSIATFGVAAHEAGHAIQDSKGYIPMKLRAGIFPAVIAGQTLGPILLFAGVGLRYIMGITHFTTLIALAGIALYGAVVLFQIITLPVELNASARAMKALAGGGYLTQNEIPGARKVLTAAALTYVAVALYSLVQLLYWIYVLFGRDRK